MKKERFKEPISLKGIIQKISYNKTFIGGVKKVLLNRIWLNVMGKNVSQYTDKIYIKNSILYLKISSSVLKQELSYEKAIIIENFNKEIVSNEVEKIIFI